MSSLEISSADTLRIPLYKAYRSPEAKNPENVPQDENPSSIQDISPSAYSSGLGSVLHVNDAHRGEDSARYENRTSLEISISYSGSMASDNEVDDGKGVADTSQSCTGSNELDSQPMSRARTHVHQHQESSPAKPDDLYNDYLTSCQSTISSYFINPQNAPPTPSPTHLVAGVFNKVAWKREGSLVMLLPTLIQLSKFSTLILLARDLGASMIGPVKLVPEDVLGNLLP